MSVTSPHLEKGAWDFIAEPVLTRPRLSDYVKIVWMLLTIPIRMVFWVFRYFFVRRSGRDHFRGYILAKTALYINRKINVDQIRILWPLKPLRHELNLPVIRWIGSKFNNYNKYFPVENASARWLYEVPSRTPHDPVILYLHGGGFFMGTLPFQVIWCLYVAKKLDPLRVSILEVDYTVTPYACFPEQLEEIASVYLELQKQCEHIIVLGDSAGGNLAIEFCNRIYMNVRFQPVFGLILMSPWVQLNPGNTGSWIENEKTDYIKIEPRVFLLYCSVKQLNDPRANPIMGNSKYWEHKLPKNTIMVWGENEILRDSIKEFAQRAGVRDIFQQRRGVHDIMCISPYNATTRFVIRSIYKWFDQPSPLPMSRPQSPAL